MPRAGGAGIVDGVRSGLGSAGRDGRPRAGRRVAASAEGGHRLALAGRPRARRLGRASPARCRACRATRSWTSWAGAAWASSTGPPGRPEPRGGPEDDPGRGLRRAQRAWPASAPRPRPWPGCSTRTSCRSRDRRARRAGLLLPGVRRGRQPGRRSWTARRCRRRRAAELVRAAGPGDPVRPRPGHHPPRPEAGQRPADGGRHAQDHRLRPGQAARTMRPPARPQTRARVLGTPSYMAPEQARGAGASRSARPPTSTRWAPSCTSC